MNSAFRLGTAGLTTGPIRLNGFPISADNLSDREREMLEVSREEIYKSRNCQCYFVRQHPCATLS